MYYIGEKLVSTADETKVYRINEITEKLFLGFAVLLLDGVGYGIAFGVQGFERRSVNEPENEVMQQGSKEGFVAELEEFADCVLGNKKVTATAEDGLICMQILDAIYESARTGHEVMIEA